VGLGWFYSAAIRLHYSFQIWSLLTPIADGDRAIPSIARNR
jgi:hypothetical protein